MNWLVRVMQEPLLHFLVLGVALFAAAHYWGDRAVGPENNTILVSEGKIRSLVHIFHRTWQRPPTPQELDGLIEDYVNEEVFYREALAMDLDEDDTVIRRRLRQKLEFVAEDLADAVEPSDDELQQYVEEHPGQYRLEDRTAFAQIYFSPQRRGESLRDDAKRALETLRSGAVSVDVRELGDPILLPIYHENLRESEIANLLGKQFSQELKEVETGEWVGPIESGYGVHLVRVDKRTPGRLPELDEIRDAVRRDWFSRRRAESKQQFYDVLRARYEVVIEMPSQEKEESSGEVADGVQEGDEAEAKSP